MAVGRRSVEGELVAAVEIDVVSGSETFGHGS